MQKTAAWIGIAIALSFLLLLFIPIPPSRYMFRSETEIKKQLLHDVPLGSSSPTVLAYLTHKTGKTPLYNRNFYTRDMFEGQPKKERYYHGAAYSTLASYGATLGSLYMVSTEVQTRWEFGADDRLIELAVLKSATGP